MAYSWLSGGTLAVRPAVDGRGAVERFVFRVLRVPQGREQPVREASLFAGPAAVVRLRADEPWP